MKINVASFSKQGGRDYNQDYIGHKLTEHGGCFIVCDGLGAYLGSEEASRLAVENILAMYSERPQIIDPRKIESYIALTHVNINEYKRRNRNIASSCTTMAVIMTNYTTTAIAHVGDTRCYHFKNNKLNDYTIDHSVSQLAVETGVITREQIRFHDDRNKLLRVIGSDKEPVADIRLINEPLEVSEAFLLCTDGFWEYVIEDEMETDLASSSTPQEWLLKMEKRHSKRVAKNNDNFSAIALIVVDDNDFIAQPNK